MGNAKKNELTGFMAYIAAAREIRCKSPLSKLLLLYYAVQVHKDGKFFKSTVDICAETGLQESFVHRTNASWKDKGFLSWVEGNNLTRKANTYTLHLDKLKMLVISSQRDAELARQTAQKLAAARSKRYREKLRLARENAQSTVTPISS